MKLKPEFTITKKAKDKNKKAKKENDAPKNSKKDKKDKENKPKNKTKDETQQPNKRNVKNKSKNKTMALFPPPNKKKQRKGKAPISRESSISTVSRGRSPRRRAITPDSEDATSVRTSVRDSSIRTTSSRASTFSDVDSQGRPWKTKKTKDPIVYTCCGFCSLGAGSLLTGLIYVGLCIGFLVFRITEFHAHVDDRTKVIWSGEDLFMDIWRILIIYGLGTAAISMLGALVLLVASCIWGQKEHYKKMRNAVIIWASCTGFAIVSNLGEAIYITVIPERVLLDYDFTFDIPHNIGHDYRAIKANLKTIWGLTGTHTLAYTYLLIVLISYLRLLKYKTAPKVGSNQKGEDDEEISLPSTGGRTKSYLEKESSRASSTSRSFRPTSQSGVSSVSTKPDKHFNGSYMNWPMVNGAYSHDDSVLDMTSTVDVRTDDDTQTLASSFYDLPPGNIYDETPESNAAASGNAQKVDKPPAPLPKDYDPTGKNGEAVKANLPNGGIHKSKSHPANLKASASQRRKGDKEEAAAPQMQPEAVSSFFKRLGQNQAASPLQEDDANPMEEMFRLFGSDLCAKHPENCDRYLKSYKDIRSKTSHLSSMRDPYEFEGLRKSAAVTPVPQIEQFSLESGPYSLNSSTLYGSSYGAQQHHIPHHQSISTDRPEPVYGFRPQIRGEPKDYPRYPPNSRAPKRDIPPRNGYRAPQYPYPPSDSVYYDDACSTCYGDFVYGDYGSYYSFVEGYPPPPMEPPPVYTPTPPRLPRYDPSMQQFSVMSDMRRPRSKMSNQTWFPLNVNDEYSTYMPSEDYTMSTRSRSLPNLAAASSMSRHSSLLSDDIESRRPVPPDITMPSPRETRKLSRSSSWSNNAGRKGKETSKRSSSAGRSHSLRNYDGYHSGDLRQRTSHTSQDHHSTRSERPSTRGAGTSRSRNSVRRSEAPVLPPRDDLEREYEEMGSVYSSSFGHQTPRSGRPTTRTKSSFSRPMSGFSQSLRSPDRASRQRGMIPDFERVPSSILRNKRASLDGARIQREGFLDDWEPRREPDRRGRSSSRQETNDRLFSSRDPATGRSLSRDRGAREGRRSQRSNASWAREEDLEDRRDGRSRGRSATRGRGRSRSRERGEKWFRDADEEWAPKGRSRSYERDNRRHKNEQEFRRTKSFRSNAGSDGRSSSTKQVKFGSTPNLHHI